MANTVEPWLRGTHTSIDPVRRAVLHALELAGEDIERWCAPLCSDSMETRPFNLPSVAFQLRHIARSLDRLMTYAEGKPLDGRQLAALREEHTAAGDTMDEFRQALKRAQQRLLCFDQTQFAEPRSVGRALLPTTVMGLLIHIAEHTQRHVGQAITTAKVMCGLHETKAN